MLFYGKYENGQRYICAYNEKKNGLRQVGKMFFLYYNAVVCRAVYDTEAEAVASYGRYSTRKVILPDGSETTPARYFGTEDTSDVFIPWYDVKGERWPGETA